MEKSEKVIASCRNKGVSSLHKPLSLFFIQNALEVMLLCPVIGWGAWISKSWDANKGPPWDCEQQEETCLAGWGLCCSLPYFGSCSLNEGGGPHETISPCAFQVQRTGENSLDHALYHSQWDRFYVQFHIAEASEKKGNFWLIEGRKGKPCFGLYCDKGLANCPFLLDP